MMTHTKSQLSLFVLVAVCGGCSVDATEDPPVDLPSEQPTAREPDPRFIGEGIRFDGQFYWYDDALARQVEDAVIVQVNGARSHDDEKGCEYTVETHWEDPPDGMINIAHEIGHDPEQCIMVLEVGNIVPGPDDVPGPDAVTEPARPAALSAVTGAPTADVQKMPPDMGWNGESTDGAEPMIPYTWYYKTRWFHTEYYGTFLGLNYHLNHTIARLAWWYNHTETYYDHGQCDWEWLTASGWERTSWDCQWRYYLGNKTVEVNSQVFYRNSFFAQWILANFGANVITNCSSYTGTTYASFNRTRMQGDQDGATWYVSNASKSGACQERLHYASTSGAW
jgi:hypothetical protein